jgi:hypothetical protein
VKRVGLTLAFVLVIQSSPFFVIPTPGSNTSAAEMHDPRLLMQQLRETRGEGQPGSVNRLRGKCGLSLQFQILENWGRFSEEERGPLRTLMTTPSTQTDRIIGRLHVYYDTTGANAPALLDGANQRLPGTAEAYVDSLGRIFNHVWSFEIDNLGYSAPPLGPDSAYPVWILQLAPGLYGQTIPDPVPVSAGPPPRFGSHMEVDNDFQESQYYSRGMSGLEVTLAHEFHHAIQLGAYGFWGNEELYFYEITSTWMEDVAYTDVNDYYQYLSNNLIQTSQFSTPDIRFTKSDQSIEYSRAVWGKFVEKRFSRTMMRRTWELMREVSSLGALDRALAESGSSLRSAALEYAYWNFNTGPGSDTSRYYTEGRNYPPMHIAATLDYLPPEASFRDSIQAISSAYYKFCILSSPGDTCGKGNTMFVIVSNVNVPGGHSDQLFPFTYVLSGAATEGAKPLNNGLYATLNVADPGFWSTQESAPTLIQDVFVFPNPFQVEGGRLLWFRFPSQPQSTTASLSVFSSGMRRVYSRELPVLAFRPLEPAISWDGRTDRGEDIATGVYFFVITVDDKEFIGKFSAIRN